MRPSFNCQTDTFVRHYQGSGGSSNTAGVKIQLEYDLLSGQFLNIHVGPGKNNDKTYGTICLKTVEAGDLCLRDLGYFDLGDLQAIHDKKAYYISRLKLNTGIYMKNPVPETFKNGTLKKTHQIYSTRYGTTNRGAYTW